MKKILIVEDDTSLYKMYVTELELRKYKVVWINSGDKAYEAIKNESPDLILLDIMLPQVDGLSILKQLKDSEDAKNIPIFMLTNFGEEENVKKALETGAEDFILKYKIVPSELADRIDEFFGIKKEGIVINQS